MIAACIVRGMWLHIEYQYIPTRRWLMPILMIEDGESEGVDKGHNLIVRLALGVAAMCAASDQRTGGFIPETEPTWIGDPAHKPAWPSVRYGPILNPPKDDLLTTIQRLSPETERLLNGRK